MTATKPSSSAFSQSHFTRASSSAQSNNGGPGETYPGTANTPNQNGGLEAPPFAGLRSSQSFGSKTDEGYSGEETPSSFFDDKSGGMRASDFKIPSWMLALDCSTREEYAYRLVRSLPTAHIAALVSRLVPVLHLDFIQILPSELSLQILSYLSPKCLLDASICSRTWRKFALEPRLWKDLYRLEGWEADEDEVRIFESEMRTRHDNDVRQQLESKRKAEESNEEERKTKEAKHATVSSQSAAVALNSQAIGISQDSSHGISFPSLSTEEDEMYPPPRHRRSVASQSFRSFSEPPLIIEPTLTIPPTGYGPPRLNWAFLFKNRSRLEENWLFNRCTPFQIPHPLYPHEGHRECIYTIQYSTKWLCSGSRDRSVRVWDIRTRRLRGDPLRGHQGSVLCLQFDESPDEDVIISGSSDASVIVWRFSTGERLQTITKAHEESVLNLRFSKKWLVTCSKDKIIKIWNRFPLETTDPDYPWNSKLIFGAKRAPLNHPHHPNYQPSWKFEDPGMTSGLNLQNPFGTPYQANIVVPKTIVPYTAVQDLQGHAAAVNAIQLHGNEIASASGDRVIKLWNLKTAKCEKTYLGHQKGIACIQFDGKTIVSGSSDQTIRVFDRDTQAEIATLRGHGALVRTVQATKNKIVSGSYDESVRIWRRDTDTGDWIPGHVLRQSQTPTTIPEVDPRPLHQQLQSQLQMAGIQNHHHAVAPNTASVQMHHIQQVGPGLAAAVATEQLLPGYYQSVNLPPPQPSHHLPSISSQLLPPPSAYHLPQAPTQLAPILGPQHLPQAPPYLPPPPSVQHQPTQQQAPQQLPQQVSTHQAPTVQANGAHRVFKLQFDARWIICCSQDTRIMGWDYAAGERTVIEASRFFLGGR